MGDVAVVIEQVPLALVLHDAAVGGVAVGRCENDALVLPRAQRGVAPAVAQLVCAPVAGFLVVVGIHQVVFAVVLEHPGAFVIVLHAGHRDHGAVDLGHVVLELATDHPAAASVVEVGLAVIVDEHARVDHGESIAEALEIAEEFQVLHGRLVGNADAHLPGIVPVGSARVREVVIVLAVFERGVRRPHETALRTSPFHVAGMEELAVVGPVDHVVRGIHVIAVHEVAAPGRVVVMGGIDIQAAVTPHVGGRIGQVDVRDERIAGHLELHDLLLRGGLVAAAGGGGEKGGQEDRYGE